MWEDRLYDFLSCFKRFENPHPMVIRHPNQEKANCPHCCRNQSGSFVMSLYRGKVEFRCALCNEFIPEEKLI